MSRNLGWLNFLDFGMKKGGGLSADMIFRPLDKAQNKLLGKLSKAAKICAEMTRDLSLIYCPIDTGALRRSCELKKGAGPLEWILSYGNQEAYYAVTVHETSHFRHQPPTKWKYLEDAINDLHNGESPTLAAEGSSVKIMSYQEVIDAVFRGEINESPLGVLMYDPTNYDEPIPM